MEYGILIAVVGQVLEKLMSLIKTAQDVKKIEEAGGPVPSHLIETQQALRKQVEDVVKALP